MPAITSFLSSPKYGYDFVVATTQASVNSGLKAYLAEGTQPVQKLCFLVDTSSGNPKETVSFDTLLSATRSEEYAQGIDPFEIPDGTDWNDPRIQSLTEQKFCVGIKMKMGLPPGILPKTLDDIVTLGTSANNVVFRMYCSELEVVENSPPSGWGHPGSWTVYKQKPGIPWTVTSHVDLVLSDLDAALETAYFDSHPAEKAAILARLKNLSGTAFSLQQLLIDLDDAEMATVPQFEGISKSCNAYLALERSFIDLYAAGARSHGAPIVSVKAVAHTNDTSSLPLTGFERTISPPKSPDGFTIAHPTPDQEKTTTLNYLCATGNHSLPPSTEFEWNWVEPEQVADESGIIAVNRNTLAGLILKKVMTTAKNACLAPKAQTSHKWGYDAKFAGGQTPQVLAVTDSGEKVVTISYSGHDESRSPHGVYMRLTIDSSYTCDIYFSGRTIKIVQHLLIHIYVKKDSTGGGVNAVDKTITDLYTLSVTEDGALELTKGAPAITDKSENVGRSNIIKAMMNVTHNLNKVKGEAQKAATTNLGTLPAADIQSFVFPGGQVFAFRDARFSDHQDLITEITYTKPV